MKIRELVEIRIHSNFGSSFHLADRFGLLCETVDRFESGYYKKHRTSKKIKAKLTLAYGDIVEKYMKKKKKKKKKNVDKVK